MWSHQAGRVLNLVTFKYVRTEALVGTIPGVE